MSRKFKLLGKEFTLYLAIAYIVIAIICLAFFALLAADSYYNYFTYSVLDKDVNGTIVVDNRVADGQMLICKMNNGIVEKLKVAVDKVQAQYPEPRSVPNITGKSISHDGSKIAFFMNDKIYISDTLGNNSYELIGGHFMVSPTGSSTIAWSLNDKYIVFCGQTVLGHIWPTYNLYIVPVNEKNGLKTLCYDVDYVFYWK